MNYSFWTGWNFKAVQMLRSLLLTFFKAALWSGGLSSCHFSLSPLLSGHFSSPVIGWHSSMGLFCLTLIGQNKMTLRSPSGLSIVIHPRVRPCTSVQWLEWSVVSLVQAKWVLFTETPKLTFPFPIGLYSQLFDHMIFLFVSKSNKCTGMPVIKLFHIIYIVCHLKLV